MTARDEARRSDVAQTAGEPLGPVQPLAVVGEYGELIEVLRNRASELGLSRLELDERTGLQVGYSGKLLGAGHVRTLGPLSMGLMLQALGLKLAVISSSQRS